jgi:hypothetical protein
MVILWLCCGYHLVRERYVPDNALKTERCRRTLYNVFACGNFDLCMFVVLVYFCETNDFF